MKVILLHAVEVRVRQAPARLQQEADAGEAGEQDDDVEGLPQVVHHQPPSQRVSRMRRIITLLPIYRAQLKGGPQVW